MKKLLIVAGVVVILAAAYIITMAVLDRQVREADLAFRASGHPATLAELPKRTNSFGEELGHILAQADTALPMSERPLFARADSNLMAPSEMNALLERNSAALEILLRAARYPSGSIYYSSEMLLNSPLPPTLPRSHDFGRLLRVKARALLAEGRPDAALEFLLADLRLADLLPSDAALIFAVVREAAMTRTLQVMREVAPQCSDSSLAKAAGAVAAVETDRTMVRAWEADEAIMHDFLAHMTVEGFKGTGVNSLPGMLLLLFPPTNRIARLLSGKIQSRYIELAAKPWYQSIGEWRKLEQEQERRTRQHSLLSGLMLPNGTLFADRLARLQAERQVTLAGLKVLRFRLAHGLLPTSLDAAGAGDAVDPYTGKPLGYRSSGTGFVLYSMGEDQQDDGGDNANDLVWAGNTD